MCLLAETISCFVALIAIAFITYIILDHLIRIPRIGKYKDRYIFGTGCDTGFGNLIAKRLDQLGCHVFAGCFSEKGETELKKVCSERLHVISLDVTKKESVRKALEYVEERLPEGRGLWGVVNNAGLLTKVGAPDWLTVEDFKSECDVNLWGLIDVTLTFLPLVKRERGRLVNMASMLGRVSTAMALPYCLSKYGIEAFTDGIRRTISYFGCKAIIIEPGVHLNKVGTKERLSAGCAAFWDKAPPVVKAQYGEEYAKHVAEEGFNLTVKLASTRLSDVVDAYEHALLARFPRERYLIGRDAKYVFIPIQSLPEWLGDWILRKLDSARPLPAIVLK